MYEPVCAVACRGVLEQLRLSCSVSLDNDFAASDEFETSPDCFASNDAFLIFLALCVESRCESEHRWAIEKFWELDAVGDRTHQPVPKYSFQQALNAMVGKPELPPIPDANETLETPGLVRDAEWNMIHSTMSTMAYVEKNNSRFGYVNTVKYLKALEISN